MGALEQLLPDSKMTDTLGTQNQGDRNIWDEPDPRVKWALDILDDQGFETYTLTSRFTFPVINGLIGTAVGCGINVMNNKPIRASMPRTIALTGAFAAAAWAFQNYKARRQANNEAVARHYIMLHPDRFPEPEMLKFGDKRVLLPWKMRNDDEDFLRDNGLLGKRAY